MRNNKTCDKCGFLRKEVRNGRALYRCINHVAPTKEELMRDCIWNVKVRRSLRE